MYRLDADNAPGVKSGDIADEVVPTLTFRAFWTSLGQSLEWSVAEIHGWFPSPEAKPWEGNQTYVYVEFLGGSRSFGRECESGSGGYRSIFPPHWFICCRLSQDLDLPAGLPAH